jgi:hypothetical protein
MEIVLLWLDDLDDLLFAALLKWESLGRGILLLGLLAALLVHASRLGFGTFAGPLPLVQISISCVVAWGSVSLLGTLLDQRAARGARSA